MGMVAPTGKPVTVMFILSLSESVGFILNEIRPWDEQANMLVPLTLESPDDKLLTIPVGGLLLQLSMTKVISRMEVPTNTPFRYSEVWVTTNDCVTTFGVKESCPVEAENEKVPVAVDKGVVAV
jgi:hypothetical protein